MSSLPYTYLLVFFFFTFVCIYGQDLLPSCKIGLMVQRGTLREVAPRQRLTVRCPVKHCGESLNVTWCKLLDANKCEQINYTENIEIRLRDKNDKRVKDELISFLTFKRISIHDDGLYRCYMKGYKNEQVSHAINISVSDYGIKNSDNNEYQLPSVADDDDEDVSWLPYLSICLSIALLVAALTVLTLLSFYGWKRTLTCIHTKGQQTHFYCLKDIHSPNTAERPLSQPPLMTKGNQPAVENTADGSQVTDCVYTVINHRQSGTPIREQHTAAQQNKNAEYAAIIVS